MDLPQTRGPGGGECGIPSTAAHSTMNSTPTVVYQGGPKSGNLNLVREVREIGIKLVKSQGNLKLINYSVKLFNVREKW